LAAVVFGKSAINNTYQKKLLPRVGAPFEVTDALEVCVSARLNNPTTKQANRLNDAIMIE
jgi:hypothetical protein